MQKVILPFSVLFLLLISIFASGVYGNHIVGGELQMRPGSGVNNYTVTLIQFWDEKNLQIGNSTTGGNRDNEATLFIYSKKNNELLDRLTVTYRSSNSISYQNQTCATVRSLRTLQGIYTGDVNLSPSKYTDEEGYYIIWERCCRSDDLDNIKDPGDSGMVFYLEFPPLNVIDSSPAFQVPNGQYICNQRPFSMNVSAIDPDGDELRYSLVTPYRGNTTPDAVVGNDSKKNGYPLVSWNNNISVANVIPGPSPLAINASTGMLTVTAGQIGLYVFTVQCEEYRDGKKIGVVRRDFQLLVVDCSYDIPEAPVVMVRSMPVTDVKFCPEQPVKLETAPSAEWAFQWQRNGLNIIGATSDNIMVQDTGVYTVVKSLKAKCSSDTTSSPIRVSYADPIDVKISLDKTFFCQGDSCVLIGNGGLEIPENFKYEWLRDDVVFLENQVQATVTEAGLFKLKVSDMTLGCTGQDTVRIAADILNVSVPKKVSIQKGSQISVAASVDPPGDDKEILWSPVDEGFKSDPSMLRVNLAPMADNAYTISVKSANGCITTASVTVNVFDRLYIPTAFSPDQDGKNDTFEIFNASEQIEEISIYNRWGQVVFQSKGYNMPWDGKVRGKLAAPGSYPYKIKTIHTDYRGEVLLLR